MKLKVIKVGLKNNARFLFSQTTGNNLGGSTGSIEHSAIIYLNDLQFEDFKKVIVSFGFSPEKSLIKCTRDNCNYSCYLEK